MQSFGQEIIDHINMARAQPQKVGQELYKNLHKQFIQDDLYAFGRKIQTFQGISCLEDLKNYLHKIKPVQPLFHSQSLSNAASIIAKDKGMYGRTENQKPKTIYDYISQTGIVEGKIGQLVALKACGSEEVATYFLLDDGLASRKRRRMLLDSNYKYIGVGSAMHKTQSAITVILLAEKVIQKKAEDYGHKFEESRVVHNSRLNEIYNQNVENIKRNNEKGDGY